MFIKQTFEAAFLEHFRAKIKVFIVFFRQIKGFKGLHEKYRFLKVIKVSLGGLGHTETGPRFKVSSKRPEKRRIDLAIPGLVV